ncbi:MAG: ATP-binding protein [bacterium]
MRQPRPMVSTRLDQRFVATIVIVVAVAVFILTWVGIRQSRSDSFELLVLQGKAFTEALAQAAENAIVSETFYDYLVHRRYAEIVVDLADVDLSTVTDRQLASVAQTHNLYGLYLFGVDSLPVAGSIVGGPVVTIPDFVYREVGELLTNPEDNYVLLLEEGDGPAEAVHYYLELTNRLDRVVVIVADAVYYLNALEQTQIGYLAQKMAREKGVAYVMYQSTEGIVFSSRSPGQLLSIESDEFLAGALDADSISHRVYQFQGEKVLELVRPFATSRYPFGLLRVGLSLDGFYVVSRGFDRQMIALAGVLFVLTVVVLLYISARRKRLQLARQYSHIKTITDKIFDEMRTGVAAIDGTGTVSLANHAFRSILGLDECMGRRWDEIIKPIAPGLVRLADANESVSDMEVSVSVAGDARDLLIASSRLKVEPGGVVIVVYDITRLKEFERRSARRERLSEMGHLAAGVAHEIRNPLNTISIAAQRLSAEFAPAENAEEYRSFIGQIKAETKRLNDIISRFLVMAHEDRKRRSTIDLGDLIGHSVEFFQPEAEKLNMTVEVDVEPGLQIEADPDALRQVFINLFNNTKEALDGQPGQIAILAKRRDEAIEITFSDSGPGIRHDLRDKVFTPYFTTKEAGTGLGLPTVHKIISELGGEVRIEDADIGGVKIVMTGLTSGSGQTP